MQLDHELVKELGLLRRFAMGGPVAMDVQNNPDPTVVAAAARMHAKGLISTVDGGQLTESGLAAADYLDKLLGLLDPPLEPI